MFKNQLFSRKPGRPAASASPASLLKAGAKVSETVLRNGMRVIVAERAGDPVVASVLFYPVGARNEAEHEAGVSHFLEHMMFKGSKTFGKGEVDRITTRLGGQNNAFTGHDHTAYWFEFASDRWENALEIEADRMANLLLDEDEFQSERAVVLEELAMGEDDPWRVLARHVEGTLFQRHPYGRPIIGFPDTLQRMSAASMRDYYERFYHVGNATLIIAGDVTKARALRAVRANFGHMQPGRSFASADVYRAPLEEPSGMRRVAMRWDDEGLRAIFAWPTVPVGTDEDYALDMALVILSSGRMSRLQKRLVYKDALASSVSSSNDTRVEAGAFWLFAECAQGVEPEALERAIMEELHRLGTDGVDAAELRRAKAVMRSSEAFDGETVSDLAEELGEWAVDYDWRDCFDGSKRHDMVTAKQVRDAVARYLTPERAVIGWSLPRVEKPAPPKRRKKRVTRKGARS